LLTCAASFRQRRFPAQADLKIFDLPNFDIAFALETASLSCSTQHLGKALNAELTKKALEKVGNPNVLVNLLSRRVRQLNAGSGAMSRPLVADTANLGAADIALLEIVEGKMGFEMPEVTELTRPVGKKRKKH
jgi:DNA-directed RNA polymerase subunit omega